MYVLLERTVTDFPFAGEEDRYICSCFSLVRVINKRMCHLISFTITKECSGIMMVLKMCAEILSLWRNNGTNLLWLA